MLEDHLINEIPVFRKIIIPNLPNSDSFYQSVSVLVDRKIKLVCNNCNQEGHSDEKCGKLCLLCDPSCGQLPKACPKQREARKLIKSNFSYTINTKIKNTYKLEFDLNFIFRK